MQHSLLHDIPRFLILFLEELFLIFNQMLSIRTFGRRMMYKLKIIIFQRSSLTYFPSIATACMLGGQPNHGWHICFPL